MSSAPETAAPRWSVVLCYYNEQDYLPATLASLMAQDAGPFQLILVDNASTDGSADICRDVLTGCTDITPVYLHEPRPGKVNALECGLARVDTPFVAFVDADTFYPPHYLRRCAEVFDTGPADAVAVMAINLDGPPVAGAALKRQTKKVRKGRIFDKHCHTGGFGQSFRTDVLRRAGGFSMEHWPYVFEDHEVMQRVHKFGRSLYDFDLWCVPSDRRSERPSVDWTYFERKLYGLVPFFLLDWYFYRFLGRRFAARKLGQLNLRQKTWLP
ncbi:MAG: glycosyltransferase [Rhodospirillaceae bacterium]|nr:glycosyltransferase [Rhodospirillaceae bacterium]